jgi:hypothetical protein
MPLMPAWWARRREQSARDLLDLRSLCGRVLLHVPRSEQPGRGFHGSNATPQGTNMLLSLPQAHKQGRIAQRGAMRPIATSLACLARSLPYSASAQNPRGFAAETHQFVADVLRLGNACKLLARRLPVLRGKLDTLCLVVRFRQGRQDGREGLAGPLSLARRIGGTNPVVHKVKPFGPMLDGDPCLQQETLQGQLVQVTHLLRVAHGSCSSKVKLTSCRHQTLPCANEKRRNCPHISGGFPEGRLGGNDWTDCDDCRPVPTILRRDYAEYADNGIGRLGQRSHPGRDCKNSPNRDPQNRHETENRFRLSGTSASAKGSPARNGIAAGKSLRGDNTEIMLPLATSGKLARYR